jgi:PEP-CTERM motif
MKFVRLLCIVLAGAVSASAATINFHFDYTVGSGAVSGVLYALDQDNGTYLVTDASGSYLGTPITGVFDPALSGNVFLFNNLLYLPAPPYVDVNGIVFELNGNSNISTGINLYWDGSGYRSIDGGNNGPYVDLSIRPYESPQTTPEPGTLALLGSGALGAAAWLRRRLLCG